MNGASIRACLLTASLVALLSTGCASLDLGSMGFLGKAPPTRPQLDPNSPTFFVELHGGAGKPRRATMPLTKPTLVSDVLAQLNGNRPFARYDTYIVRQTPNGELKLPLQWKNERNVMLNPASDYAIHPNDRLILAENGNTYMDDVIDQALQPLSFLR